MTAIKSAPDTDLAQVFDGVNTAVGMARALAICCSQQRRLSFPELMREQADTKRRVVEAFGPSAEKDLQRFTSTYPALANRAEFANVSTHPEFAIAAVRVMRELS